VVDVLRRSLRLLPRVPEAGERQRLSARQVESLRLFLTAQSLPLIEAVGWNNAAVALEGFAIGIGGGDSVGAGVDSTDALYLREVFGERSLVKNGTRSQSISTSLRSLVSRVSLMTGRTALLADRPDAESIAKAARAFGQEDDITVLTIRRLPIHDAVQLQPSASQAASPCLIKLQHFAFLASAFASSALPKLKLTFIKQVR
jgi:hypothetical protein